MKTMEINYNEISEKYDEVRKADLELIKKFEKEINFNESMHILDFGCGTGNYTNLLKKITNAKVFGVEPSAGMRQKALAKNEDLIIRAGNHANIPFANNFFDFVYMTDVIHHIPNLNQMFKEFKRVLKNEGLVCIETESYQQIDERFYVKYFPGTAEVDKKRYPSIDKIVQTAADNEFSFLKNELIGETNKRKVNQAFLKLVENKGYSMFHLISEDEYKNGLIRLKEDLNNGPFAVESSGGTLVWLKRKQTLKM
jgi:ubiquinone/menaquinone biosynthesis C-methylase UbiE